MDGYGYGRKEERGKEGEKGGKERGKVKSIST